jgi:hypothetical protein
MQNLATAPAPQVLAMIAAMTSPAELDNLAASLAARPELAYKARRRSAAFKAHASRGTPKPAPAQSCVVILCYGDLRAEQAFPSRADAEAWIASHPIPQPATAPAKAPKLAAPRAHYLPALKAALAACHAECRPSEDPFRTVQIGDWLDRSYWISNAAFHPDAGRTVRWTAGRRSTPRKQQLQRVPMARFWPAEWQARVEAAHLAIMPK